MSDLHVLSRSSNSFCRRILSLTRIGRDLESFGYNIARYAGTQEVVLPNMENEIIFVEGRRVEAVRKSGFKKSICLLNLLASERVTRWLPTYAFECML